MDPRTNSIDPSKADHKSHLTWAVLYANLATFFSGTLSFKLKKMKTSDPDTCITGLLVN